MKFFKIGGLTALIASAGFTSCQREVEGILDLNADSAFIRKVISFDTTKPPGMDTGYVSFYEYDSQKRVVKMTETEYDMGTLYSAYSRFSYNGTDTMPAKMTQTFNYVADSSITTYFYNGSFIVKDSTTSYLSTIPQETTVQRFSSFGPGRFLLRQSIEFPVGSGTIISDDSVIYTRNVVNGNITGGLDSVWQNGVFFHRLSIQSTYDNKRNPYHKILRWYFGYYHDLYEQEIASGPNNIVTHLSTYTPGGTYPVNINYSYNNKMYPVVGRVIGGDYNKLVYIYINL